jgi:hypothetical protein
MKVFEVMLLIGVVVIIAMGTIFSAAMFQSVSVEGNSTHEAETITSHMNVSVWIYIIGSLLVIAAIIMAFKLMQS